MKSFLKKYQNIDKSTAFIFSEEQKFKVLRLANTEDKEKYLTYSFKENYIQFFFSKQGKNTVAFNQEHCAVSIDEETSYSIYFKDMEMNLLFHLPPKNEVVAVLISIDFFHALFSDNSHILFNFKLGKPIIEPKKVGNNIKLILNQITSLENMPSSLKSVYIQGKVYELLSHYFNTEHTENETCPFIANEEVITKIKKVKEIIIEQMNTPPSLSELAKEVGLNIKKLKTGFKDVYGYPVFTFLLNYKMELAKKLLQEQQLNVNEIALQLGYSSSSHFIAAFKRKYGITPKQFSKIG
ncbi:MAG: helix-turn-helix transcriptional regulator [Flavobacteriaceae bacterium]|nr:helix-turn-helix transcriptional regulator [Flavobacteriaceae bacterium]